MHELLENKRRRKTGKPPCDCHQCSAVDEAFGFDGEGIRGLEADGEIGADLDGEDGFDDAGEARRRQGRRRASVPCSMKEEDIDAVADGEMEDFDDGEDNEEGASGAEDLDAEAEDFLAGDAMADEDDLADDEDEDEDDWDEDEDDEADDLDEDGPEAEEDWDGDDLEDEEENWAAAGAGEDEDGARYEDGDAISATEMFTDSSFDVDALEDDDDQFEVRHISRPGWPGIRRVSIRKNRSGEEPFTQTQQTDLRAAASRARAMARKAEAVLNSIWAAKRTRRMRARWRGNADVVRWFGTKTLTRQQIRITRGRIRRIRKALDRGIWFVVVQHQEGKKAYVCDGGAFAYAYGGSRIFLCPPFFTMSVAEMSRTIIHELVHRLGWAHPRLPGTGKVSSTIAHAERAGSLARRFPVRARRSPVNFAWFFEDAST